MKDEIVNAFLLSFTDSGKFLRLFHSKEMLNDFTIFRIDSSSQCCDNWTIFQFFDKFTDFQIIRTE